MFITFDDKGRVISAAGSPEELAMYETIVGSKAAERFSNEHTGTLELVPHLREYTTEEIVEELMTRPSGEFKQFAPRLLQAYNVGELVEALVSRKDANVQSVCLTAGERFMVERDVPYLLLTVPYSRSVK